MHISDPLCSSDAFPALTPISQPAPRSFFIFFLCTSFTIRVEFFPANVTGDADGSKEGGNFCFFAFVIVGVVSVDRAVFRRERPGVGVEVALMPFSFSVKMSFFHFCVVPC